MSKRTGVLAAAISCLAIAISGCGGGGGGVGDIPPERMLVRGIGANPDTVDPHKAEGTWENTVIGDMFMGLFTENAAGEPVPGMAQSWETSEDGLVWTFTLRDAVWSDGEPVTADDFVFAMRRLMDPKTTGVAYSSLLYLLKNAQAVNGGQLPVEELGVAALDDHTLQLTLEYPAPYLPGLLKHYVSYPIPQHVVEKVGDAWTKPENIVVNGAYKLREWRTGDYLLSIKNPNFIDAQNVCFDAVVYNPSSDDDAMIRLAKTGKLDINDDPGGFPSSRLAELERDMPGWPRLGGSMSTTYLVLNNSKPPFDDARVRQALAMALNREFITTEILGAGQKPAYAFVPPGMNNYPEGGRFAWADAPRAERLEKARSLLEAAGYGPGNPLAFEYAYRNSGDNPKVSPVIQANWAEIADWVKPEIRQVETRVLYNQLQEGDFISSDAGWVADFNDPYNFLFLLDSRTGAMNYGRYSNPDYDAILTESNLESSPDARAVLLRKAEQTILDDTAVIPMLYGGNRALVNPEITGFEMNLEGIHRSRYMCREGLE